MSLTVTAILAVVDWKKVLQSLSEDSAKTGVRKGVHSLIGQLKPDEQERLAKQTIELFSERFMEELKDKSPLSAALFGYRDQLKQLIESTASDITGLLQPELKDVDLSSVERTWSFLGFDPLPLDFDWALVAKSYARDLRAIVRGNPNLREQLSVALLEQEAEDQRRSRELLDRLAGPDPGFALGNL